VFIGFRVTERDILENLGISTITNNRFKIPTKIILSGETLRVSLVAYREA